MSVPFRCSLGRNDSELCLNGASCVAGLVSGLESCSCPNGFAHDFTVGYFPNCAIANGTLLGMGVTIAVLSLIGFVIAIPVYRKLRALPRRLLGFSLLSGLFNMGAFTAVAAQGGSFYAAHVLVMLQNMAGFRALASATIIVTEPIYAMIAKDLGRFKRILVVMEACNCIGHAAFVSWMCYGTYQGILADFNLASMLYLIQFPTMMIFLSVLSLRQIAILRHQVRKLTRSSSAISNNTVASKLRAFGKRLDAIRMFYVALVGLFAGLYLFPAVTISLGSFPGQYILKFVAHLACCFPHIVLALLLRTESEAIKQPSTKRVVKVKDGSLSHPPNDNGKPVEDGQNQEGQAFAGGGGTAMGGTAVGTTKSKRVMVASVAVSMEGSSLEHGSNDQALVLRQEA